MFIMTLDETFESLLRHQLICGQSSGSFPHKLASSRLNSGSVFVPVYVSGAVLPDILLVGHAGVRTVIWRRLIMLLLLRTKLIAVVAIVSALSPAIVISPARRELRGCSRVMKI